MIRWKCLINEVTFFLLKMVSDRGAILHIFWRLKVRFRPVQTGSAGQCYALNLELDRRSSSTISLNFWTEPGFGSARFRFELWFRTEPRHHYNQMSCRENPAR